MRLAFADSFFFFALLNPKDSAHQWAVQLADEFAGRLITSTWVLTEVGDGLASCSTRSLFVELLQELDANDNIRIAPHSDELWSAACALYSARPDKDWSLTDCSSFVVMQREGLTEALTGDLHFAQAGFAPLLK